MNTASSTDRHVNRLFLYLFLVVLAIDLFAIVIGNEPLRYFSKPMLMPALGGYFLINSGLRGKGKWIALALLFSWFGDVFLLFESKNSAFFLLGLSAFLIAHIFYILFFHHVRTQEKVKSKTALLIVVALYYAALVTFLYPYLGEMKIVVPVYGIVISFMLLLALHMLFIGNKPAGQMMAAGAVLFVVSDSLLAINKFYSPFENAGLLIMLIYGLAQVIIVAGAIRYLRQIKVKN